MTTPYIGCRISLISRNDVRYEGILNGIDSVQSEVVLQNVQCFGTEDRRKDNPVQPSQDTYGFIRFRGSDIKDLHVSEFPPFHDEAMMGMQGNYGFPRGFVPQYGYAYGNPYQYNPYLQYNYDMMAQMRPMGDLPLDPMAMHDPQAFNMPGYPMYNYDPTGAFNSPFQNFYQQQQAAAAKNDSDEPPSVPKGDNQAASNEKEPSKPIEVTNPQDSKEKASETKSTPTPQATTPTPASTVTPKEESSATPAATTQEESAAPAPSANTASATHSSNNNNKKSSGLVYQPKKKPQNQTEQQSKSSPTPVKSQPPQNNNQSNQSATPAPSANTQNHAAKKEGRSQQDQDYYRKNPNEHYKKTRKQLGTWQKQQPKAQQNSPKQSNTAQQSSQSPQVPAAQAAPAQPTAAPSPAAPSASTPQPTPDQVAQENKGQQGNKQEQQGSNRNGGGYRNNNRGRNHNRRRGHPSTGKFTGSDSPTTVFEEEFDFESSLAKFDKEKFVDDLNEDEKEIFLPPIPTYEKSSFFDNISCEALERESEDKVDRKTMLQQQRKLDAETFGASHSKSNRNYRGRGRSSRGGRGNHQRQDRNGDQNKIYKPKVTTEVKASSSNN